MVEAPAAAPGCGSGCDQRIWSGRARRRTGFGRRTVFVRDAKRGGGRRAFAGASRRPAHRGIVARDHRSPGARRRSRRAEPALALGARDPRAGPRCPQGRQADSRRDGGRLARDRDPRRQVVPALHACARASSLSLPADPAGDGRALRPPLRHPARQLHAARDRRGIRGGLRTGSGGRRRGLVGDLRADERVPARSRPLQDGAWCGDRRRRSRRGPPAGHRGGLRPDLREHGPG